MRMTAIARAAALGVPFVLAACAEQAPMATSAVPTTAPGAQTGSMAYPPSHPAGQFTRPAPTRTDVGSMAYPNVGRPGYTTTPSTAGGPPSATGGSQTGSVQYPPPNPAGTLPTKTVR